MYTLFLAMNSKLKRLKEPRSYSRSHVHMSYCTIAAIANVLELTVWQLAIQYQFKNCAFLLFTQDVTYSSIHEPALGRLLRFGFSLDWNSPLHSSIILNLYIWGGTLRKTEHRRTKKHAVRNIALRRNPPEVRVTSGQNLVPRLFTLYCKLL